MSHRRAWQAGVTGLICAVWLGAVSPSLAAPDADALPRAIERLLDADPIPHAVLGPNRRYVLLVHERRLLPLERLARPSVDLAGRRIDPGTVAPHAQRDYHALTIIDLHDGREQPIELPSGSIVGYPSFAADGSRFAFTLTRASGTELWIGEPAEMRARPLIDTLNAALGPACEWTADSRRLLCKVLGPSRSSAGPVRSTLARSAEQIVQQPQLGQPVLLGPGFVSALLESQLLLIDSVTGQRHLIGQPAAYESAHMSPAGAFLLVTKLARPYPSISGIDAIERTVELWDRTGRRIAVLSGAARAVDWLPAEPATLVWIQSIDGRDHVVRHAPPYKGKAVSRFELPHRFAGLRWLGDGSSALVSDYDAGRRTTQVWNVDFSSNGNKTPRVVLTHDSTVSRIPLTESNRRGVEAVSQYADGFYVQGRDANGSFMDRIALDGSGPQRIWQHPAENGAVEVAALLADDASWLLTRERGIEASENYWIERADGKRSAALLEKTPSSTFVAEASVVTLKYERNDGLPLQAALHLPPGYDGSEALPLIVWAYPSYVPVGAPVSVEGTNGGAMTFERAFRSFYLLHGYAVLDDVAMPIVGTEATANDTFVEQIIANADAAIAAAARTGMIDAKRVGVAGHSYGASMVANLLAHSDLFAAGAALSGAYNRTLTPFGFQTERRTLWQAPQTYFAMSPLLYSHQIHTPLLLVHGLSDDNAGTSPLQSTQFYEAIRGNQGDVRLLLLPWEGHTYRARESLQKTAIEMLSWFDRYLKPEAAEAEL